MMKSIFRVPNQPKCASAALLLLRLIAGAAMMFHGWGKIQNPMAWMGADAPVPGVLQLLAALSEFGGGLAWILGLLVPLASLGMFFTMLVAVHTHMNVMKDPFVNTTGQGGSYELAAIYLAIAIVMGFVGAGKFSLDAKIFGEK